MNSAKDFFDSIINENDISLFTYGLKPIEMPNLEKAQLIQNNTPDAFLKEYYNAISAMNKIIGNDSGTNTLNSSAILLRLIHINAEFKIDSKSLAELLIDLSNQIKEFSTTYEHHKYDEYLWGSTVAYKLTIKADDILTYRNNKTEQPLSYEYIIEAISQIPITYTILAGWKYSVFKSCGLRVERNVSRAVKALYLYDHLMGCGVKDLLLNNTKEKAEKKLKPLYDAALQNVADKILEFYLCKTGNEKKRFLTDIENFINEIPITELVNNFLINS
jgi:hypothetical protein